VKSRKVVCVLCPLGCKIRIELDEEGNILSISGNKCPRGEGYAKDEIKDPKRVVTTSVKVLDGELPLASVKTDGPIPKKYIFELMKILKSVEMKAPVNVGDVVVRNIFETNVNVVITRSVGKKVSDN